MSVQSSLIENRHAVAPFKSQLLKWIGNKQRFAHEIASYFPNKFNTYFEPFLGSGAVLGTLAPSQGIGADSFKPLVEIWQTLKVNPKKLIGWYRERWVLTQNGKKKEGYEKVKASYNSQPNAADLLFLSRSCYGGVIRFRQSDGYMSTPCGVHDPISPESFERRVTEWNLRVAGTMFTHQDFQETLQQTQRGDLVYCDPPYSFSQSILYGAQSFALESLLEEIAKCKRREVNVALSIDGSKKSGDYICDIPIPKDLFKREIMVNCGKSMLRRFQMNGKILENEDVADRLLLTY